MSEQKIVILRWQRGRRLRGLPTFRSRRDLPHYPLLHHGRVRRSVALRRPSNIWGAFPIVDELQSEGGAAGAVHGALQAGAFATTFTASQGLLLMIPNMYKIAGELTPAVMHVTARALATHALSIFGDHSDVMACRQTGWAMLASIRPGSPRPRPPSPRSPPSNPAFPSSTSSMASAPRTKSTRSFHLRRRPSAPCSTSKSFAPIRERALTPDHPSSAAPRRIPTSSSRPAKPATPYYPPARSSCKRRWTLRRDTGRAYHLFDYYGAPDAERVIILMGSGAGATEEAVDALNARGEKIGMLKVRLYRPFAAECSSRPSPRPSKPSPSSTAARSPARPASRSIRTSSPSSPRTADHPPLCRHAHVIGGRYGLSSKEFTPAMVKGVFDELAKPAPKNHFTIGIDDDVTHISLTYDPTFSTEDPKTVRALFYGLGSDGTVGANKNSIKIIGSETPTTTRRATSSTTPRSRAP